MKLYILALFILISTTFAKNINVAVHEIVPFVMEDDKGNLSGYEIELWNHISERMGFTPNYIMTDKFSNIFDAIRLGNADYGLAGITINYKRASEFDFAYPHKKSGLGILIRDEYEMDQLDAILTVVTNKSFIKTWALFFIFVIIMAHIIWFTERGSDSIPDKYTIGFEIAIWYMFVVVTTVGFGDVVVKKRLSKLITILTFFVGIGLFGAAITQLGAVFDMQMQTYSINNVSELKGKSVAVVGGTTSELSNIGVNILKAKTSEEAVLLLEARKVDAVVFDAPTLQYYAKENSKLTTVGGMFNLQDYGVIMKKGNVLRDSISLNILEYLESDAHRILYKKWFD